MKAPIKSLSTFVCLLVLSSINLSADFDLRARSMTRDLMPDSSSVSYPNVVATSDAYVQSLNSSSLPPIPSYSIELNSIKKRALNIRYYPSVNNVNKVEFYINETKISEDSSSPYDMYDSANWLPSVGSFTILARSLNSAGAIIQSEQVTLNISDALSHRMRKVKISTGVPNQTLSIKMKDHEYVFGSQTVESGSYNASGTPGSTQYKPFPVRISGTGANYTQSQYVNKYQEVFLKNFNMTVAGNAMKWYSNGNAGTTFTSADRWLDWHEDNNIRVRGHTLLWGRGGPGGSREMYDPEWIENLMEGNASQQEQAKQAIKTRIQGIVSHYAGRVDEWDFNNELWNGDKYRKEFDGVTNSKNHNASGDSILKEFADWAIEANPNIKLYHNDYNIITQGNTNAATSYRNLLIDLRNNHGVPVDGIGVQGHFGSNSVRSQASITNCFNILDDLGVPIKVTELDCGGTGMTANNRAQQLENVYRAAFEHEMVEGVLMWGFWSGCHWRRERAPWQYSGYSYNSAGGNPAVWTETPQVSRYQNLVFGEWWTNTDVKTDSEGNVEFTVFAGDFDIEIDGQTIAKNLPSNSDGDTLMLTYMAGNLVEQDNALTLLKPLDGAQYYLNQPIELEVGYPDGGTPVLDYVEFFVNDLLIKKDSVAPYETNWYDAPNGNHTIRMVAHSGMNVESSANITVSSSGIASPNLIVDGGFENGSVSEPFGSFGGVNTSAVTSQSNGGNYSARIANRTMGWNGIRYDLTNLELEIGETYEISFYGRLNTFDETINLNLKVANGNSFNYPNIAQETYTGDWVLVSAEFEYTGNENLFYVSSSSTSANMFLDDFALRLPGGMANPTDTDMDGMLDTLELTYFGDLNQSATSDYDNDGVSNVLEIRSGTNPNDANSYFKVLGNQFNHGLTQDSIAWAGNSGKNYTILGTDDLQGNWEILTEAQSGSLGLDLGVGDGSAYHQWSGMHSDATQKFYRVILDD